MRKVFYFVLVTAYILSLFSGCSHRVKVKEESKVLPYDPSYKYDKLVILPFECNDLPKASKGWYDTNSAIHDLITEIFYSHNTISIPNDEVFYTLKSNNFLNLKSTKTSSSLVNEYNNNNWSRAMKGEIAKILKDEKERSFLNDEIEPLLNISEQQIYNLGKHFNAKFVVKGSISKLSVKDQDTLNPLKVGFSNFPTKFMSRTLYGKAKSDSWGTGLDVYTGALIGGVFGSMANEPFSPSSSKTVVSGHPLMGNVYKSGTSSGDYQIGNSLFWGAVAGFTTYLGSHGGYSPEVGLIIRVYVYDVASEDLVWTNRVKLSVSTETMWAEQDAEKLVYTAIRESVYRVFAPFWTNYKTMNLLDDYCVLD